MNLVVTFVHTSRLAHLARSVLALGFRDDVVRVGPDERAEILLFRGARGWSIVVTDPDDSFLLDRRPGRKVPRLAELARSLGRGAVAVEIESGETIFEANARGAVAASGLDVSRKAHGWSIPKRHRRRPALQLLRVPGFDRRGRLDVTDLAESLCGAFSPEILLGQTNRLFGREYRPARSLAFANAVTDSNDPATADPDFDSQDS